MLAPYPLCGVVCALPSVCRILRVARCVSYSARCTLCSAVRAACCILCAACRCGCMRSWRRRNEITTCLPSSAAHRHVAPCVWCAVCGLVFCAVLWSCVRCKVWWSSVRCAVCLKPTLGVHCAAYGAARIITRTTEDSVWQRKRPHCEGEQTDVKTNRQHARRDFGRVAYERAARK